MFHSRVPKLMCRPCVSISFTHSDSLTHHYSTGTSLNHSLTFPLLWSARVASRAQLPSTVQGTHRAIARLPARAALSISWSIVYTHPASFECLVQAPCSTLTDSGCLRRRLITLLAGRAHYGRAASMDVLLNRTERLHAGGRSRAVQSAVQSMCSRRLEHAVAPFSSLEIARCQICRRLLCVALLRRRGGRGRLPGW